MACVHKTGCSKSEKCKPAMGCGTYVHISGRISPLTGRERESHSLPVALYKPCGKLHIYRALLEKQLITEQGTDLIDLRRLLEGVLFGMDPFGGHGGCHGLRYGRIISFLRKSFNSILRRLRTSKKQRPEEERRKFVSTRVVGFAATKKILPKRIWNCGISIAFSACI